MRISLQLQVNLVKIPASCSCSDGDASDVRLSFLQCCNCGYDSSYVGAVEFWACLQLQ
jgi:hypothetical protein